MKLLSKFSSKLEAEIFSQSLQANGIRSEVHGAKDYSSFVTGADFGAFEVYVEDEKYDEAFHIFRSQRVTEVDSEPVVIPTKSYLKKAVIFSLLAAVMVPLVFNYVAFVNLSAYLANEPRKKARIWAVIGILILQIPTILMLAMILNRYLPK